MTIEAIRKAARDLRFDIDRVTEYESRWTDYGYTKRSARVYMPDGSLGTWTCSVINELPGCVYGSTGRGICTVFYKGNRPVNVVDERSPAKRVRTK